MILPARSVPGLPPTTRSRSRIGPLLAPVVALGLLPPPPAPAQSCSAPSFAAKQDFVMGSAPIGVEVADFNNDGKLDVVTADSGGATVSVRLGNGLGDFPGPPITSPAGSTPFHLAVGDFNGDGRLDVAVTNFLSAGTARVLFGNGTGSFPTNASIAVGAFPRSVAAADFDRDGKLDLAVANSGSNFVSILQGTGGGLAPGGSVTVGNNPVSVAVGDFDRNGRADLAVLRDRSPAPGEVVIVPGNGNLTFGAQTILPLPAAVTQPEDVVVVDLNRDGHADLAVADGSTNDVSVILADGLGGFLPAAVYLNNGQFAQTLAPGDFDGDGRMDLAVPNASGAAPGASILLGNGSGGLVASGVFVTNLSPVTAAAGDLNGDGRLDLVTANSGSNDVSVLRNTLRTAGLACAQASFGPAGRLFDVPGANPNPSSLVRGELNGDGLPDLLTTNFGLGSVTLLPGAGFGGFGPSSSTGTGGAGSYQTALGDFDGDGKLDLAVANSGSGNVSFLRNLGGGAFAAFGPPLAAGTSPIWVEAADLNADGKLDVAVANNASADVSILLGNGDGTFTPRPAVPLAGSAPISVARGDFDGNGRFDLAVADSAGDKIWILLGDGTGTFPAPVSFGLGVGATSPISLVVADIDGDGDLDVATANNGSSNVAVLLGNGAGGLSPAPASPFPLGTGIGPRVVVEGDFNGDGKIDLATADTGSSDLAVLLGDGLGGFGPAVNLALPAPPTSVVAGDFTGDGFADLAATAGSTGTGANVLVLRGNGLGGFDLTPRFPAGTFPRSVAVADFDRDGHLDLAAPNAGSNNLSLLRGLGAGAFAAPVNFAVGTNPQQAAVGDWDRDGKPDLAVANSGSNNVAILYGDLFAPPTMVAVGAQPRSVAAGDFDQDGDLDLAVANNGSNSVSILRNTAGVFALFGTLPAGSNPEYVAVGDFDRDGRPDLAVANSVSGNVALFQGLGGAAFGPAAFFAAGTQPISIAVADLNGDGKLDLAVANQGSLDVSILEGNGLGGFLPRPSLGVGRRLQDVAAADLDGDGRLDLALANQDANAATVFLGDGAFGFGPPRSFAAGSAPRAIAVGDFNRDGKPDLALANQVSNDVGILLNTNCLARRLAVTTQPASPACSGLLTVQPVVEVLDDGGNRIQCDAGVVDATLLGPGTLSGTTSVATASGAATYTDLAIAPPGRGHRLQFDHAPTGLRARSRRFTLQLTVNMSGPTELCAGVPALYTSPFGYDTYEWRIDGGLASVLPTLRVPGFSPPSHVVDLQVTESMCTAMDSEIVTVNADLSALSISVAGATTVCQATGCTGGTGTEMHAGGGTLAYQWGFRTVSGPSEPITQIPGQTASSYVVNGPDFPGPGTYYLVLEVRPACGPPLVSNEVTIVVDSSLPQDTIRFFTVRSQHQENRLEWLNPPGYNRVLIRYTSGPACSFPASPVAGSLLVDQIKPGPGGERDFFLHGGLTNGQTYCYTIFVDQGAGGPYSAGRSNRGRPFDHTCATCYSKWAYSVGTTSLAPVGVGVDAVHAAANDNALHSIAKPGRANEGTWPPPWLPLAMNGPSQGRPSTVPVTVGTATRVVFLGSQDGSVYAVDADRGGSVAPLWQAPLGPMVQAAPSGMFTAFGGNQNVILVGTRDSSGPNKFHGRNVDDGTNLPGWPVDETFGWGRIGIIHSQAAVDYTNRRVYFTSFAFGVAPDDRTVWCVDLSTPAPSVLWARPHANVSTSPTLRGNRLYVGTIDGKVLSLDTADGSLVWQISAGDGPVKGFVMVDRLSPTNDLFFSTTTKVHAYEDPGGPVPTPKWATPRMLPEPSMPVVLAGGAHVYVGAGDGRLYRLHVADGTDDAPTFPFALGNGLAGVGSPTIDVREGFLYVGSEAGVIYAVQIP